MRLKRKEALLPKALPRRSVAALDAETLAALWFSLAEAGDLAALNRALAVGKRRLEGARAIMRGKAARYRAFQHALVGGLASPSPRTRFECAHALDVFGDASTRAPLAPLMDDPVPRVRWMAMHALSCHACGEKAEALEGPVLDRIIAATGADPSPQVRRHAAVALALAHAAGVAPSLRERLEHETNRKVQRGLAWALAELARPAKAAPAGVWGSGQASGETPWR